MGFLTKYGAEVFVGMFLALAIFLTIWHFRGTYDTAVTGYDTLQKSGETKEKIDAVQRPDTGALDSKLQHGKF